VAPGPAGARRFHLFVPPGLVAAPGETFALLVMLHGCRQTGSDLAAISRMNRIATRKRFVLYPEQERMANSQGCWNWYERRSGKADAEAATVLAAVDQVARRHPAPVTCGRGGPVGGCQHGCAARGAVPHAVLRRGHAFGGGTGHGRIGRQRLGRHARHP
jgi:hypothetical protein